MFRDEKSYKEHRFKLKTALDQYKHNLPTRELIMVLEEISLAAYRMMKDIEKANKLTRVSSKATPPMLYVVMNEVEKVILSQMIECSDYFECMVLEKLSRSAFNTFAALRKCKPEYADIDLSKVNDSTDLKRLKNRIRLKEKSRLQQTNPLKEGN